MELANCGPVYQIIQLLVFNMAMVVCLHVVCGSFQNTVAQLSRCGKRLYRLLSPKYLLSVPLMKNLLTRSCTVKHFTLEDLFGPPVVSENFFFLSEFNFRFLSQQYILYMKCQYVSQAPVRALKRNLVIGVFTQMLEVKNKWNLDNTQR